MKEKAIRRKYPRGWQVSMLVTSIPLIGFLIFGVIPLVLSGVVSFTELHTTDLSEMRFIGFCNFITIITNGDNRTYWSYLSTLVYSLNVPICIALALFIANLVNKTRFGQRFFRSVFFIPYVCSTVVVSLTFKTLYAKEGGVFNAVLAALGFEGIGWINGTATAFMVSAIIMTVWSGLGYCIVLYQAALSKVDSTYYEAAIIDGATSGQMFWKITWPAITPTTSYLITMKLIWALQSMAEMWVLADRRGIVPYWPGSDAWVSDTVVKHIYNMVFEQSYQYGYGLAAAAGWILALIVLIVTRVNMKLQERWVVYDF